MAFFYFFFFIFFVYFDTLKENATNEHLWNQIEESTEHYFRTSIGSWTKFLQLNMPRIIMALFIVGVAITFLNG
jgi:hypothetical protein